MDCAGVRELLDAHALGATEGGEGRAIEAHVEDCIRCWEELGKARQTAALLALSAPLQAAPAGLEARLLERALRQKPARPVRRTEPEPRVRRFAPGWRGATAGLAIASVGVLAFTSVLQVQMNDLRGDKNELARELAATQHLVQDQTQAIAISSASDEEQMPMKAVSAPTGTWGEYHWSPGAKQGFIVCHNMPPLGEGKVYQAWFETGGRAMSAGTFQTSEDGGCVYPMRPEAAIERPTGVGVSVEEADGSETPTGEWLIFASFKRE